MNPYVEKRAVSPLGCRAHQAFPFAQLPRKSHLAGRSPTERGGGIAAFAPLGVVRAFVIPARNKMCDANGSCSLRISPIAAFTSRIASPSALRAFCRRLGRICSHEHYRALKVKHPPLGSQTPGYHRPSRVRVECLHPLSSAEICVCCADTAHATKPSLRVGLNPRAAPEAAIPVTGKPSGKHG